MNFYLSLRELICNAAVQSNIGTDPNALSPNGMAQAHTNGFLSPVNLTALAGAGGLNAWQTLSNSDFSAGGIPDSTPSTASSVSPLGSASVTGVNTTTSSPIQIALAKQQQQHLLNALGGQLIAPQLRSGAFMHQLGHPIPLQALQALQASNAFAASPQQAAAAAPYLNGNAAQLNAALLTAAAAANGKYNYILTF